MKKKTSRKTKMIVVAVIIAVLMAGSIIAVRINHSRRCHDIIGDGYAMGTDREPVVIGNTCDFNDE